MKNVRKTDWTASSFLALLIILVVVGHINSAGFKGPFDMFTPYTFHVAGFGFVSGYLYSARHDSHPLKYCLQRFKKFLIPLFAISLFFGILTTILRHYFGFKIGADFSLKWWVEAPLFGKDAMTLFFPMWFIAPFCFSQCIVCLMRNTSRSFVTKDKMLDAVILLICLALGAIPMTIGTSCKMEGGAMLLLCRTLFFLPWLSIGRFYATCLKDRVSKIRTAPLLVAIMLFALVSHYVCKGKATYIPSWCQFPHNAIVTYYVTILGIAFWWRICKVVAPRLGKSGQHAISKVSDNTFTIMNWHILGFFILKVVFFVAHQITGALGSFDVNSFLTNGEYFYYPHNVSQFALLYVLAGTGFSLLIASMKRRLKSSQILNKLSLKFKKK